MRERKPLTDEEGEVRELLLDDMKRFRPIVEVLPPASLQKLGLRSRTEQKTKDKEKVTLQLSRDVLARFRDTGPGWQARLDAALREWLEQNCSR